MVTRRGGASHVEPWPGVSLLLEPLPGNALRLTYERQGEHLGVRFNPLGPR